MDSYPLNNVIGEGTHGMIYRIEKEKTAFALKLQKPEKSLRREISILKKLCHPQIPKIISSGLIEGKRYFIMPIYQITLWKIINISPDFFTPKAASSIGIALINILRYIHEQGYIYRDIKPENVMIGYDNKIHLIDFGLVARYRVDGVHYKERSNDKFVTTPRYSSLNIHNGTTYSRRDDMEALGYLLVFLMLKSLPWFIVNDDKHKEIGEIKKRTSAEKLCKDIPYNTHWVAYFTSVKSLKFYQEPRYLALEELLTKNLKLPYSKQVKKPKPSKLATVISFLKSLVMCC